MAKVTAKLIQETVDMMTGADEISLAKLGAEEVGIMSMIKSDFFDLDTMPKGEATEKVKAYADAKPVDALERLVQLQKKHVIDFESASSTATFCADFVASLLNALEPLVPECLLVAEQYVNEGGVALTCEVLSMHDHVAHKDDSIHQPNTAYNISSHLTLIVKAFYFESLHSRLGEVLRTYNYFNVLIPYTTSR